MISLIFILIIQVAFGYKFKGDVTVYSDKESVEGGSCGLRDSSFDNVKGHYFAMNSEQYDNSLSCGTCIEFRYKDNEPVIMLSADICPECKTGDVDLSGPAWNIAVGTGPDRHDGEWDVVNCDKFVNGNIRLRFDEINLFWFNLSPENFLCRIDTISIEMSNSGNWEDLTRDDTKMMGLFFNYAEGRVSLPIKFKMTSIHGDEIISPLVTDITTIIDMGSQFKCEGGSSVQSTSSNHKLDSDTPSVSEDTPSASEDKKSVSESGPANHDTTHVKSFGDGKKKTPEYRFSYC